MAKTTEQTLNFADSQAALVKLRDVLEPLYEAVVHSVEALAKVTGVEGAVNALNAELPKLQKRKEDLATQLAVVSGELRAQTAELEKISGGLADKRKRGEGEVTNALELYKADAEREKQKLNKEVVDRKKEINREISDLMIERDTAKRQLDEAKENFRQFQEKVAKQKV